MATKYSWDDDKLERKQVSEYLTSFLIDAHNNNKKEEAVVISLNAPWGFGKTFFLNRWMEDIKVKGHPVVYFDAWNTDFSNQPLVTFVANFYNQAISQIKDLERAKITLDSAKESANQAIVPIIKSIIGKYSGVDLDKLSFDYLLEEYKKKNQCIEKFSSAVDDLCSIFAKEEGVSLPVFIFIDEMDRCRPNYAIELLESIKHLFYSKNLCFVVATDSDQLSKSIKAVYGPEFDSTRYLHRFFDQEYRLPDPDNDRFAEFLFAETKIDSDKLFNPFSASNTVTFSKLSKLHKLSIREQKKAYNLLRALVLCTGEGETIDLLYATMLIMLKITNRHDFDKFLKTGPTQENLNNIYSSNNYDNKVTITISTLSSRLDHKETQILLTSALSRYGKYMAVNLIGSGDIFNRNIPEDFERSIQQRIQSQVPRQYQFGDVKLPDIHFYAERIQQLGQILD